MVVKADRDITPHLESMWTECFGDTPDYARFIFSRLIRPEFSLVYISGGQPVSMLFYHPFTLKMHTNEFAGAYIFGVATTASSRGKGISTALLSNAHDILKAEGYSLSVLVPANTGLFNFYTARGYTDFSFLRRIKLAGCEIGAIKSDIAISSARLDTLFTLRESFFAHYGSFVSWSGDYLAYNADELEAFGGETLLLDHTDALGYAVCVPDGDDIIVKELAIPHAYFQQAASAIHGKYRARSYNFRLQADFRIPGASALLPYSMVKWYDIGNEEKAMSSGQNLAYISLALD